MLILMHMCNKIFTICIGNKQGKFILRMLKYTCLFKINDEISLFWVGKIHMCIKIQRVACGFPGSKNPAPKIFGWATRRSIDPQLK